MRGTSRIAVRLLLVLGLAADASLPSHAACPGARAITSSTPQGLTGFYTPGNPFTPTANYPYSPYGGTTTYYVNGVFWSVGGGDPTYGLGNDSGYFKGYSPVISPYSISTWIGGGYYGGFPTFIGGPYGSWQIPGIDGCVDFDGSDPGAFDADECTVVLLTDEANQTGYFAALSVNPTAGGDFVYNGSTGFPAAIEMAPIPAPIILASAPTPSNNGDRIFTVHVDPGAITPANGFYFTCGGSNLMVGYKIYLRTVPGHDQPKPVQIETRSLDQTFGPPLQPWVPVTGDVPIAQPVQFLLQDCQTGGDFDYYVCATLLFDGVAPGAPFYELKNCSRNATKIECGPTLADPIEEPEQRRIDRGDTTPSRDRGPRRGR